MASVSIVSILIAVAYSAPSWDYDEIGNNVSNWINSYPECGSSRQSPIDIIINDETSNCEAPILLKWTSAEIEHFVIRNNGHSLQAIPFEISHQGGTDLSGLEVLHHTNDTDIRLRNSFYNTYKSPIHSAYCFDSLHFHWGSTDESGSEHTINGKHYPLEVHLVHYACDYYLAGDAISAYSNNETAVYDDENVLAVIGVLFEIGAANPALDSILNEIIIDGISQYDTATANNKLELFYTEFNLIDLLPDNREIVAYLGSLTTPPCYETVRWHVMKNIMTVSQEQMEQFRLLLESTDLNDSMAPNFRPVQDIGDRVIYQCWEEVEAEIVEKDTIRTNNRNRGESRGCRGAPNYGKNGKIGKKGSGNEVRYDTRKSNDQSLKAEDGDCHKAIFYMPLTLTFVVLFCSI